jgi:23S rRNA (pseudouridine1915-N3)-methyltransferase
MNITILTIGKLKNPDMHHLIDEYIKRLPWDVKFVELEVGKPLPDEQLKVEEAKLLLAKIPANSFKIVLDERGKNFTSPDFAKYLGGLAVKGNSKICFIIGGAAGLTEEIRKSANEVVCLSQMTFPHMLVRLFLAEQLYRAFTIINGKAYHK